MVGEKRQVRPYWRVVTWGVGRKQAELTMAYGLVSSASPGGLKGTALPSASAPVSCDLELRKDIFLERCLSTSGSQLLNGVFTACYLALGPGQHPPVPPSFSLLFHLLHLVSASSAHLSAALPESLSSLQLIWMQL